MRLVRSLLLVLVVLACDDGIGPVPGLEGLWALREYVDAGVVGTTTGTMAFNPGGTFETLGTVTFPGEPEDSLTTNGTWSQTGTTVSLTAEGQTSSWRISGTGQQVSLRLLGQTAVTRIGLQRIIR